MYQAVQHIKEGDGYYINVGPQHPATHGVLHLKIKLNGEIIEHIDPKLGYIHRSIEKMCEKETYRQFFHLTSRMDYLSANINNQACALVVEKGLEVEVPERAKVIRILLAELTRISSHLLWWGVLGMDLGAITPFFIAFRDREKLTEIFERTCGGRLTMAYIVPGGLMYDLHPDFQNDVKQFIADLKSHLPEFDDLLTYNEIFMNRTKGVGYLSKEDAISYGVTGPTARASGVSCDVRKWHPYDGYEKLDFEEIVMEGGDSYTRYEVRMQEFLQSISIIEQLIDNIPEGDFQAQTKKVIKLPKGKEYYQRVETARGEFGIYLVSGGGMAAHRMKFRSPGFSNLSALNEMAAGTMLADLVAIMGTIDLVIPDIDR